MQHDKKNQAGQIRLVILKQLGQAVVEAGFSREDMAALLQSIWLPVASQWLIYQVGTAIQADAISGIKILVLQKLAFLWKSYFQVVSHTAGYLKIILAVGYGLSFSLDRKSVV